MYGDKNFELSLLKTSLSKYDWETNNLTHEHESPMPTGIAHAMNTGTRRAGSQSADAFCLTLQGMHNRS